MDRLQTVDIPKEYQELPVTVEIEVLKQLGHIEREEQESITYDLIQKTWDRMLSMTASDFINCIKL